MKSYICPRKCDEGCQFFNEYSKKCTFDEKSYQQGRVDAIDDFSEYFLMLLKNKIKESTAKQTVFTYHFCKQAIDKIKTRMKE